MQEILPAIRHPQFMHMPSEIRIDDARMEKHILFRITQRAGGTAVKA